MTVDEMAEYLGLDSLRFISLDGLYRAAGHPGGRDNENPQYTDSSFSGDYPVIPTDMIAKGFEMKSTK